MLGFHSKLSEHEVCKRLLVAESEVNRAQLNQELAVAKVETQKILQQAVKIGTVVSSVALVVAAIKTLRRGPAPSKPSSPSKSSWLKRIFNGARLASTVWSGFKAAGQNGHEARHEHHH